MDIRIVAVAVLIVGTSACSYDQSQYQLASASDTPVTHPPMPGAAPTGPWMLNSDNEPVISRTGINSDPRNPAGTPRGSGGGSLYD